MKNFKSFIYLLLVLVFLSVNISGCSYNSQIESPKPLQKILSSVDNVGKSPQAIFLKAWKAIKDEYLDKTYNDQDWSRWKSRYYGRIQTPDDAYLAIETMVESLDDPYTRFLPPSDFAEQDRSIDAKLYGIGIHIAQRKDNTVVVSIIEGSPAEKSQFKVGDIITMVNGKPTKGLNLKEVADMVRGQEGSKVKISILRNKTSINKLVTRAKINIKSVEYKMLDNKYAYIKLSTFISQDAALEFAQALMKTKNSKGIILDLRNNYGGLLPNAVIIANMFINKGPIVSIVDRNGEKETIDADQSDIYTNKPLVILINGSSASASEILSGALKDHKRAVLVGEKTFGKGLVQKIEDLPDGSGLNITIAKYLTPKGTDINKKGIDPDYKIKLSEKDFFANKDPQLVKAKQVLSSIVAKSQIVNSQ